MPLKDFKMDFCHLKRNSKAKSMLGSYYRAVNRSAVMPPGDCPFSSNTNILLRGLTIEQDIPQFMPEANYTFKGKYYANKELGLVMKITGGFYINDSNSTI
ncbi:uncharacterized protein LOC110191600 [Drosophila serrata]|uniref:uncharacterized protein LOC110191600 n=1 Tax=Drosophila serrata TaxID=7274 RepID=UPI000A1D00F8|nr:uncharacterized protein LOC110191600 [Drosophila serrata]